jgi:hypothetical protein
MERKRGTETEKRESDDRVPVVRGSRTALSGAALPFLSPARVTHRTTDTNRATDTDTSTGKTQKRFNLGNYDIHTLSMCMYVCVRVRALFQAEI